eukprot:7399280-Prorocentrum_lima.AAC.1
MPPHAPVRASSSTATRNRHLCGALLVGRKAQLLIYAVRCLWRQARQRPRPPSSPPHRAKRGM